MRTGQNIPIAGRKFVESWYGANRKETVYCIYQTGLLIQIPVSYHQIFI